VSEGRGSRISASVVDALRRRGLNYASTYAIAGRVWQLVAGPVTMLLMARCFTAEEQGWYYTLASLLALQTLCELGLTHTLLLMAGHLWGGLSGKGSEGREANRLLPENRPELAKLAALRLGGWRWMSGVAVVFVVLAGAGGTWFLSQTRTELLWLAPWWTAVACAAVSLPLSVDLAILEGCERTASVHRSRLWQALAGNLAVWTGLLCGAGLWVVTLSALVRTLFELALARVSNRSFWSSLPSAREAPAWRWSVEVGGLQWRSAVRSILMYLSTQLFTPILFRTEGPVAAGRFGMTWSILSTLQNAASAWVQARGSELSILARQGRREEFQTLYTRMSRSSFGAIVIAVTGAVLALSGLVFAQRLGWAVPFGPLATWFVDRLASRVLDPLPTLLLGAGVVGLHPAVCQFLSVRARLQDPWFVPSIGLSVLTGAMTFAGAWYGGATGLAAAFAGSSVFAVWPVMTYLHRRFERDEATRG
jgi:O-antigen/teichoic acid export membrane protein